MALLTPEYLQTKTYTAQRDRWLLATHGLQEGMYAATDFQASQRAAGANMSLDVAAGTAFVLGDDTTRQGLYHVVNDGLINVTTQTSGTVWANGDPTNPRIDQLVLQANDTIDGGRTTDTPVLGVVQGTPTAGATLDNRSGALSLPASCLRLADVLIGASASTATTANIRDRRPWARGIHAVATNANGATTLSNTSYTLMDAAFKMRVECSGSPIALVFAPTLLQVVSNNAATLAVDFFVDGTALLGADGFLWGEALTANSYGGQSAEWMYTPSAPTLTGTSAATGSHLIEIRYKVTSFNWFLGGKSQFRIRELPAGANNGIA